MFGIGTTELLILFGIVIVIFRARRLPELGSGLGKAIKNFKAGVSGKDEIDVTPNPEKVTDPDRDSCETGTPSQIPGVGPRRLTREAGLPTPQSESAGFARQARDPRMGLRDAAKRIRRIRPLAVERLEFEATRESG